MWEYVFDFQQRIFHADKLNLDELCLLFYFEKNIVTEENLKQEMPSLTRKFCFNQILADLPILYIKRMQLRRLIDRLINSGYIEGQTFYSGITISITKKTILAMSKKQQEEPSRVKYLCLINWSKNVLPKLLKNEQFDTEEKLNCSKMSSWGSYYINYITNTSKNSNINNILDTSNVNSIGSNKGSSKKGETFFEKLKPLFDKYSRFIVEKATLLPSGFDCSRLLEAMKRSKFLQDNPRINLEFLLSHYAKIITKDKAGRFYYDDYVTPDTAEQKIGFTQRTYTAEQLDMLFDDINEVNL